MPTEEEINSAAMIKHTANAVIEALLKTGSISPPKTIRKKVNWEKLLSYEYVASRYHNLPHWFRIEVGPIPGDGKSNIYARTRRWCDIIVRGPKGLILIECKMRARPDVVSQLLNYKQLLSKTPLFEKYWNEPIELQLVTAIIDVDVRAFVEEAGIEVIVYKPSNFEAWYKFVVQKERDAYDAGE